MDCVSGYIASMHVFVCLNVNKQEAAKEIVSREYCNCLTPLA